jgi:hypothetical protein
MKTLEYSPTSTELYYLTQQILPVINIMKSNIDLVNDCDA